jgi:hypothetical protein
VPASDDAIGSTVPAVHLVPFHRAEFSLAGGLLELLHCPTGAAARIRQVDWHKTLGWLRDRAGPGLAPGQQEAAQLALSSKIAATKTSRWATTSPNSTSSPTPGVLDRGRVKAPGCRVCPR